MALGQRRPRDVIHHSDQSLPRRRPGQPVHLARVRQALQGSRRAALNGLGRRRWSLSSGRRSRTRGTMPCARASLLPSNANYSSGAVWSLRSRHAWPASASSKASTIPPGGIPPWGIARPFATNRRCKQTDSPPPPEPSTEPGQLQSRAIGARPASLLTALLERVPISGSSATRRATVRSATPLISRQARSSLCHSGSVAISLPICSPIALIWRAIS